MNNIKKPTLPLLFSALIIIGVIGGAMVEYIYISHNQNNINDKLNLSGNITIKVDNKTVYHSDLITYISFATIFCKLFNDSSACSYLNTNAWGATANNYGTTCQYWSIGATAFKNNYYTNSNCNMTAIAFTNLQGSNTNFPGLGCPGAIITANGMTPAQATTAFTVNTNSITLSASWTATGTQTLGSACIIAWNTKSNTYAAGTWPATGFVSPFAIQTISPALNLVNGNTVSVQWTITV